MADAQRGILLAAFAYMLLACADAAVKFVLPGVGVAGVMLWRGVVGCAVILAFFGWRQVVPRNTRLIMGRAAIHCVCAAIWYWCWARGIGLADSYAVGALAPIFMTLIAIPLLGERIGWRRALAVLAGFGGALVMLQPGGALWRWEAGLLVFATAVMALSRALTRLLARTDTPAAIAFWLMAAHVPLGLLLWPFFPPPVALLPDDAWLLIALAGFAAANAMAHMLFARAFALAPVGALAPLEYSFLPWGVVLGLLLFAEVPGVTTLYGAAIVIAAGLYTLHREQVRARERHASSP